MALQSILHDPNISKFLDQIPQNQHIITLKQLIYIGIKIVSNSFAHDSNVQQIISAHENKQNRRDNHAREKKTKKSTDDKFFKNTQNDKKFKKSKNHIPTLSNHSNKIQSTLLREISKIRLQLQSLTNKVYDHYFDENQQNQSEDSLQYNAQQQADYIQSKRFNYPEDIPTFSPAKQKLANSNSYASNPFLKQKNNFFATDHNNKAETQTERRRSHEAKNTISYPEQQQRCRAKSNVMHLDDTQIRQALYKDNQEESEPENMQRNKQKKSHSMIEKRHQQKKKDQQNYFYQLSLDKQNLKELQKFKESKQQPDASYRDFVDEKPPTIDHFKKKAKSKIKYLVQRDRLRHQTKVEQENFKKGFEQYEYSANQMDENEQEEVEQSQQQQENQNETFSKEAQIIQAQTQKQQRSYQEYANSPQAEFERERRVSNPNFGFYNSNKHSEEASRKENSFNNNNQSFPEEKLNFKDNESSFSEFSEFSMSSSNSKRQVGKISRRRHE